MVDVAAAVPPQRVAQPPALGAQRCQHLPHLSLGARAYRAALCQPRPTLRVRDKTGGSDRQRGRWPGGAVVDGGDREDTGERREHERGRCALEARPLLATWVTDPGHAVDL